MRVAPDAGVIAARLEPHESAEEHSPLMRLHFHHCPSSEREQAMACMGARIMASVSPPCAKSRRGRTA